VQISKWFTEEEATCKCGSCTYVPVSLQLLVMLDSARDFFDAPITVTCMVRCPAHNEEVGGAKSSRHLPSNADAADIKVKGIDPSDVMAFFEAKWSPYIGVHAYNTFTHIDARGTRARW